MRTSPILPTLFALSVVGLSLIGLTACNPESQPAGRSEPSGGEPEPLHVPQLESPLGPEDGYVATGERLTLADSVPAIERLDPALRDALEQAAAAAAERGIQFSFTDGWRSERYQQYLVEQAVQEYGSVEEARRWAKSPEESQHVVGLAVDVATADAMDWLVRFGADYGLCQIYANELWHFEYVADADGACPAQLPDSSA